MSRDEILAFFKGVDPVPDSDRERRLMERGEQTRDEQTLDEQTLCERALCERARA